MEKACDSILGAFGLGLGVSLVGAVKAGVGADRPMDFGPIASLQLSPPF
jgi:hypothetical protein